MLYPVVFARPVIGAGGSVVPSEPLRQYAFSSTLAIQDITGDVTSGQSAKRMAVRLAGSNESDAFLFALCDSPPGPRPTGAFGFPEVASTGESADPIDAAAWLVVSLPLLEDRAVLEAHITVDSSLAPLPGEPWDADVREAWDSALALIDELSNHLSRPVGQLWLTHNAAGHDEDSRAGLVGHGYVPAHMEYQATLDVTTAQPAGPVEIAYDMEFPVNLQDEMAAIYTEASENLPRGELLLETIHWTPQRVRDAAGRLRARGGEQITAFVVREERIVAFSEAMRFRDAEESVIELGATYVAEGFRGQGLGRDVMMGVLDEATRRWPAARTGYTSYPAQVGAIAALNKELGETIISATTAWQKSGTA